MVEDFSETIDALGAQITPELAQKLARQEGNDTDAELALIAWDRHRHPLLYQELDQRYLRYVKDPLRHSNSPPGIPAEQATEKCRLAWEYILIAPPFMANEFYPIRATEALRRIGNDASLTTYKFAFTVSADPKIEVIAAESRQQLLLEAMSGFHDQQALLTMLACLTLSQQQMAHQPKVWDSVDNVKGLLASPYQKKDRDRWHPIILSAMSLNLPTEQKVFLNTLLKVVQKPLDFPNGISPPGE
jgi:hypothetical protein